jgi:hypothetical protein
MEHFTCEFIIILMTFQCSKGDREKLKPSILDTKDDEGPYDRHLQEFRALWDAQDVRTNLYQCFHL